MRVDKSNQIPKNSLDRSNRIPMLRILLPLSAPELGHLYKFFEAEVEMFKANKTNVFRIF